MPLIETATERLLLRAWRDSDLPALAALNADAEVMRHFPSPLDAEQSAQMLARMREHLDEHGFGFWALQRRDSGELIGVTGLARVSFAAPFVPAARSGSCHWMPWSAGGGGGITAGGSSVLRSPEEAVAANAERSKSG